MKIGKLVISVIILCALMMSLMTACEFKKKDFEYFEYSGQLIIKRYNGDDRDVTIPAVIDGKSVNKIGEFAFSNCKSLTSITIPDSVTCICNNSFSGCSSLTSITIPDSVMRLGLDAFSGCNAMTEINASPGNPYYSSEAGILYNKDKTIIVAYPLGIIGPFEIPDTVTEIGGGAFIGCSSLTSITIPDQVTRIGSWAFCGCTSLTSITLPDGITFIGEYAFFDCDSLAGITIPDNVMEIGSMAFASCTALKSITIPNSVRSIGFDAFNGCEAMMIIKVSSGNPKYSSDGGILYSKDKTTIIYCPAGKVEPVVLSNSVINIAHSSFAGCKKITSIKIPDGVTNIDRLAFYGCSSLTSITIPDSVTSIGGMAFDHCDNLVIQCREDSYAHSYAVENGIKFNAE